MKFMIIVIIVVTLSLVLMRGTYSVDLVIFAFRFVILELFTKYRIRELSILMIGSAIKIIFARFLNSRIFPPLE